MSFPRSKSLSLTLVFLAVAAACPSFAQSSAKSAPGPQKKEASASLRTAVAGTPSKSGWGNELELRQTQPVNGEVGTPSSFFWENPYYSFNETYSAGIEVSGTQKWPQKREGEEPPKSTFLWDDTYVGFSRKDEVSMGFSVGLPTSEFSKKAGRQFSFTVTPSVSYDSAIFKLKILSYLTYFNNKWKSVEDKEEKFNEAYSFWPQIIATIKFTKDFNWYTKATVYQGVNTLGEESENYTLATGPDYRFNKALKVRLTYNTQDKVFSDHDIFSRDISSYRLAAFISF